MNTAIITITRSSQYANRLRKIRLFCDDKKIGTIDDGEVKSFTVPSGAIKIKAKIDWAFTKKGLDIEAGQEIKLKLYSPIKGWKLLFAFLFIFLPTEVIKFGVE